MSSYTITITPDDGTTTTTLRLDTSGGTATLTDLHLHAPAGLSTGKVPAIDYGMLLAAIATNTPTPIAGSTGAAVLDGTSRPGRRARGTAGTGRAAGASRRRETDTAAPAKPARGRRAAGTAAKATKATGRAGAAKATTAKASKATAGKATTGTRRARGTSAAAADSGSRVYRRMPDDLATVYRQTTSATAIADLYGVPRHTVNGWLRRLREQGLVPPAAR